MSDSPIKLLDILSLCSISLIMQSSLSSRFPFLVVGLPSIWIVHSSFDLFLPSFISFLFFINISICKVLLVALLIYIYWVFFSQIWRNSRLLLLCVHRPCPALFLHHCAVFYCCPTAKKSIIFKLERLNLITIRAIKAMACHGECKKKGIRKTGKIAPRGSAPKATAIGPSWSTNSEEWNGTAVETVFGQYQIPAKWDERSIISTFREEVVECRGLKDHSRAALAPPPLSPQARTRVKKRNHSTLRVE